MNVETEIDEFKNTDQLITESIDFFVRLILWKPRSVGEIYGLLYFSPDALSMEKFAPN